MPGWWSESRGKAWKWLQFEEESSADGCVDCLGKARAKVAGINRYPRKENGYPVAQEYLPRKRGLEIKKKHKGCLVDLVLLLAWDERRW